MDLSIYLWYYSAAGIYFSFRWGPFVHSLEIVQWDSTRRDHSRYPGRVSGSGLVSISMKSVYRNCPIVIQAREFLVDLIPLPFREIDLILGMDWLSKHRAIVDCGQKTVVLRCSDQTEVIVQGIGSSAMSNVISAM